MSWYQWRPYVSVAQRRRNAEREMAALRKKGVDIQPVTIEGRKIARTFWGEAWCDHLESYSDYANRLPRGRTYVRNGSVCHLAIQKGRITAKVMGSELYEIQIDIAPLPAKKWKAVCRQCAGQIGSLIELLQGKLSDNIMDVVTDRSDGLFPSPREISLDCDCPDWATMCKHVAAVLYGVGARLDTRPELLFLLRGVDHEELIAADAEVALTANMTSGTANQLQDGDLSDIFGIELADADDSTTTPAAAKKQKTTTRSRKSSKKTPSQQHVAQKKTQRKTVKKKTAQSKKAKTTTRRKPTKKKTAKKETTKKTATKKKTTKRSAKKAPIATTRKKVTKKKVAKKKTAKKTVVKKKATAKTAKRKT